MARLKLEEEAVRQEAIHEAELKKMETGLEAEENQDLLSSLKKQGQSLFKDKINQVNKVSRSLKESITLNGKILSGAFAATKYFCPVSERKVRNGTLSENQEKVLIADCLNGDRSEVREKHMVNEQKQTILNELDELRKENPNLVANEFSVEQFIANCQEGSAPISAIVNFFLNSIREKDNTIHEKDEEIKSKNQTIANYQAQTQGLNSQLSRNKPRRLSLQEGEIYPTSSSPRPDLPSPFRTPATPTIPELECLSNLVHQRESELEQEASQVIADLRANKEKLLQQLSSLNKQLEQKESLLRDSETERQEQTHQLTQLVEIKAENTKLRAELKTKEEQFKQKEKEADETNTDFLLAANKVEVLQEQVKTITNENVELQHYLNEVSQERDYLKRNQKRTHQELLDKIDELTQLQKSAAEQKEELEDIIYQREEAYESIRQQREVEFQKQLDNLRLFQNSESNKNKSLKRLSLHNRSLSESLPNSGRSTPNSEKGYIIFPGQPSPKFSSGNLSAELEKQGFSTQGGIISKEFTSSPASEYPDPFEQAVKRRSKRSSTLSYELLTNQVETEESAESATDEAESSFTALMSTAKYELAEVQSSKGKVDQELQTAQDKIRELENKLRQRENDLNQEKENLHDELVMVKNESNSQKKVLADLVDNVSQLKEAEEIMDK
ncbi:11009_t:CDS:2, partial [Paraglomus occultum]